MSLPLHMAAAGQSTGGRGFRSADNFKPGRSVRMQIDLS
jgi:hypothetical protein